MFVSPPLLVVVVAALHCPVFAQRVQRLQLLDDELTATDQLLDFAGIPFGTVAHEGRMTLDAKLLGAARVLFAEMLNLCQLSVGGREGGGAT